MPVDSSSQPRPGVEKGLPAVVPPSGRFMVQLFLVPFIIVTSIIGFLLLINWWIGGPRSPDYFLAKLDDSNHDIRWRGAEELAQVLQRDESLSQNPRLALELADRFNKARQDQQKQSLLAQPDKSPQQRADQQSALKYVMYLGACVGSMMIPVGTPLLAEAATNTKGADPAIAAQERWWALWTLAKHGDLVRRLDKLPEERRLHLASALEAESEATDDLRRDLAKRAARYLAGSQAGKLSHLGVDRALLSGAEDSNPFVREIAAFAMNYWQGTSEESAALEEALARLTWDNGKGEEELASLRDAEPQGSLPITKTPGLQVRYNATIALARRGSGLLRLGMLSEMLDEAVQRENFHLRGKDGRMSVDEAMVAKTLEGALQALAELKRKQPAKDVSELTPLVERLAHHANPVIRKAAQQTQYVVQKKEG